MGYRKLRNAETRLVGRRASKSLAALIATGEYHEPANRRHVDQLN
jgi:hypothetical protein